MSRRCRACCWFVVRWGFCWHPLWRLRGACVAPVRGGSHFLCRRSAAKKVTKESGLTPPVLVRTHGPPTSPCLARKRAGMGSLSMCSSIVSSASYIRRITKDIEVSGPRAANLCRSSRHTRQRPHWAGKSTRLASRRFSFAARRPTQSLPHRARGHVMSRAATWKRE